jgi:MFS family permease
VQLISALLLFLTFTADTATKMVIYQAIGGFFLESFFSTFWALPMTTVPRDLMGVTGGFINMAGQIAAFISPIVIGYLVEAEGGGFALTFAFLIASILVSSVVVFTVSKQPRLQQAET